MHLTRQQTWLNNLLLNGLNSLSGSNIVLLGLVIGAMMAIDMGGPFNKARYVFATAKIDRRKCRDQLQQTMVGGMIPPLAIATAMISLNVNSLKNNVVLSCQTM